MFFKSLKEKCEYYRGLTDYKILPNSYVLVMVDGHCFSKLIKNKFEKPFDDTFINIMNEVAKYLCENIQGCKFAYTQSDEISLLITDFDTPETDSFFGFRLCKMQSLIAAMATAKFNQLYAVKKIMDNYEIFWDNAKALSVIQEDAIKNNVPLCTFDAKVWAVPNANDAFAWFLYRQNDCVRNSKQQTAQSYLPHKELVGKSTDVQVQLALEKTGVDWNTFDNGKKYGRLIYREPVHMSKLVNGEMIEFDRNAWTVHGATPFNDENNVIKTLVPNYEPLV